MKLSVAVFTHLHPLIRVETKCEIQINISLNLGRGFLPCHWQRQPDQQRVVAESCDQDYGPHARPGKGEVKLQDNQPIME